MDLLLAEYKVFKLMLQVKKIKLKLGFEVLLGCFSTFSSDSGKWVGIIGSAYSSQQVHVIELCSFN